MDSGGREQNYWPGFVDALSNVVLTLVFVLVIFVFALVIASNKVERKMQEVVQSQKAQKDEVEQLSSLKQTTAKEAAELKKKLAEALAEISALRAQAGSDKKDSGALNQTAMALSNADQHIEIVDKDEAKTKQGVLDIRQRDKDKIVLGFPLSVTEMDEKSATELGHIVAAIVKSTGKHKILLRSIVGKESFSAARRLAYYRAINTRNFLLTKSNENPNNITTTIIEPTQPEDGRVEIVFEKQ